MSYLLDTNILIESETRTPFDIFPSFWEKIKDEIIAGHIFTSVKVKDEIQRGNKNDALATWIESLPESFFINLDPNIMRKYAQVINCASSNPNYLPAAQIEFASASIADAFLIATASAKQMILVTNEISEPRRRNKIKIPDVASQQNVTCRSLLEMLRALKVSI